MNGATENSCRGRTNGYVRFLYLLFLLCLQHTLFADYAQAELDCPAAQQITEQFDNGAAWEMCWDARKRENIVLSQISYTAPGSEPFPVLSALRLAQLHVAYDDSEVTYNDITQFGLGAGFRTTLLPENCPAGELIDVEGRPGLCKTRSLGDDAYRTPAETRLSESLTLFSVSQVGSYAYIVTWKFFADGSIEPSIGAAGALQRSSDWVESPFGRQLEDVADKSWLSHTHNYYWQLDFDLGIDSNDDVISEISYPTDAEGRRARKVSTLTRESARAFQPTQLLEWRISDSAANIDTAPGYTIQPLHAGHHFRRGFTEPFSDFDFFVTRYSDCERFVSENAKFNPDCDENILQFVDNEPLDGEDIVAWHRVSFHHLPRNEDRQTMHSHWDGFVMRATNMASQTPGHSGLVDNTAPVLANITQHSILAKNVNVRLEASDAEGDRLTYTANGLPPGLMMAGDGLVTGKATAIGVYPVNVRVLDNFDSTETSIEWIVSESTSQVRGGSGSTGPILFYFLAVLMSLRALYRNISRIVHKRT